MMLIKVHARPINPSDIYTARGVYGKLPGKETAGMGKEGAGKIIQVSKNLDLSLVGKKAAFINLYHAPGYEGTWREYIHIHKRNVVIYPDYAEYNKMAWSFINPQTVCYFWYLIEKNNHKAVIQDAACSSLGKMFMKLCQKRKSSNSQYCEKRWTSKRTTWIRSWICLELRKWRFYIRIRETDW